MENPEKLEISLKAIMILAILQTSGFGRNRTTKLALKLLARMIEHEYSELTDEIIEQELDFLMADINK